MTERDRFADRTPAVWEGAAEALPGVARIAGTAWLRSASWAIGSGARSARNLARGRSLSGVCG